MRISYPIEGVKIDAFAPRFEFDKEAIMTELLAHNPEIDKVKAREFIDKLNYINCNLSSLYDYEQAQELATTCGCKIIKNEFYITGIVQV